METETVLGAVLRSLEQGRSCVLATVVEVQGSVPRQVGAKMALTEGGEQVGTVGGGALEAAVVEKAKEALCTGQSRLLSYDLRPDLGMACGGRARVFLEVLGAPPRLYLFGAGHIGQALCPLAARVGFAVTVVDDRTELACAGRFPQAVAFVHSLDPERWQGLVLDEQAYCVVTTASHQTDARVVQALIRNPCRYLGMIGSRTKRRAVEQVLAASGAAADRIAALITPIGLPIGAETPEEIAVSIAADLVRARRLPGSQSHPRSEQDGQDP